jgi:hypothetical protein
MSEYWEPVLCPISPEFVKMLRQPGGLEYTGRFRIRLQDDGVLVFEAVHDCFIMQCDTGHIDGDPHV